MNITGNGFSTYHRLLDDTSKGGRVLDGTLRSLIVLKLVVSTLSCWPDFESKLRLITQCIQQVMRLVLFARNGKSSNRGGGHSDSSVCE